MTTVKLKYSNVVVALLVCIVATDVQSSTRLKNIDKNKEALVKIVTDETTDKAAIGTGVFINDKGYVLTARRLIAGKNNISVHMLNDQKPYKARKIADNVTLDLAIIKIDFASDNDFLNDKYIRVGRLADVEEASSVYMIGFNANQKFLSELGTMIPTSDQIDNDCSASGFRAEYNFKFNLDNPVILGNSGGPIVSNRNGYMVGLVNYSPKCSNNVAIKSDAILEWLESTGIKYYKASELPALTRVKDRGHLICGVNENFLGLSSRAKDDVGEIYDQSKGLEADLCRAVAIAVFGQHEGYTFFKDVGFEKKYEAIVKQTVDVVFGTTTWTSTRDMKNGVDFGPVYFHDGQKFMVKKNSDIKKLTDLSGKKICVRGSTTTQANLASVLGAQLDLVYQPVVLESNDQMLKAIEETAECDALTGDESMLIGLKYRANYSQDFDIIPDEPISYEPLAVMVPEDDSQWREVVSYAILSTMWAEQQDIDSDNVRPFATDTWNSHGLDENTGEKIIKSLGNYSEIYDRSLGEYIPERGRNIPVKLTGEVTSSESGWMIVPPMEPSTVKISMTLRTQFKSNESELTQGNLNEINQFMDDLRKKYEEVKYVSIEGFTDSLGGDSYNVELSKKRAASIEVIFESEFPNAIVVSKGSGKANLVKNAIGEEDKAASRRVELSVIVK